MDYGRVRCIVCKSTRLEQLKKAKKEYFVIGDRRIFRCDKIKKEKFYRVICKDCGTVQFYHDDTYVDISKQVFGTYGIVHNNLVKDDGLCRLDRVCSLLQNKIQFTLKGKLLDLGCGGGEFFSLFRKRWPCWDMYGMDIGEQFRDSVLQTGAKFFSSLEDIKSENMKFDLITMNGMLSLSDNPDEILKFCQEYLSDNGHVFLLDTCFDVQPWVMCEVEARSLFTRKTVENILQMYKLTCLENLYDSNDKEMGYVCAKEGRVHFNDSVYECNKKIYEENVQFLNTCIDMICTGVRDFDEVGIFGTSLAGAWCLQVVQEAFPNKKCFFIDEVETEIGMNRYGLPVYAPSDIHDTVVVLPFPSYVANEILERVKYKNLLAGCRLIVCGK